MIRDRLSLHYLLFNHFVHAEKIVHSLAKRSLPHYWWEVDIELIKYLAGDIGWGSDLKLMNLIEI